MKNRKAVLALAAGSILAVAVEAQASGASVIYENGLVSIRCKDTPLSQVFDQLKAAAGLSVILDGAVKSVRLTAEIEAQPLNFALERLLEGAGVNYAMFLDRGNWQKVAKIYIGSAGTSGGSVARGSSPVPVTRPSPLRRGPAARPTDAEDEEPDEPEVAEPETAAPADNTNSDPNGDAETGDQTAEPPGASPSAVPNYLPPPQSFPRSGFTPGIEQNPFGSTPQPSTGGSSTQQPSTSQPSNPPPAYFPFFDAFGRPIPVNPQQQQQPAQQGAGQQKKQQ